MSLIIRAFLHQIVKDSYTQGVSTSLRVAVIKTVLLSQEDFSLPTCWAPWQTWKTGSWTQFPVGQMPQCIHMSNSSGSTCHLENIGICGSSAETNLYIVFELGEVEQNTTQLGSVMWDHSCGPPVKQRQKTLCWPVILGNGFEMCQNCCCITFCSVEFHEHSLVASQKHFKMLLDSANHQVTFFLFFVIFFHLLEVATDVGCAARPTASLARRAPAGCDFLSMWSMSFQLMLTCNSEFQLEFCAQIDLCKLVQIA